MKKKYSAGFPFERLYRGASDEHCQLYYDKQVGERGAEKALFKIPCGYAELVDEIQDKMIQELVMKGIGIETNPSSNYLIGTIKKYEEHPIIRFNGRKLKNYRSRYVITGVN